MKKNKDCYFITKKLMGVLSEIGNPPILSIDQAKDILKKSYQNNNEPQKYLDQNTLLRLTNLMIKLEYKYSLMHLIKQYAAGINVEIRKEINNERFANHN